MNTRVLELGTDNLAQGFLDFAVDPDIFYTVFLIFLIWLIFTKLQPSFIEYAKVYSNNIANEVVNSAVDDVFVKEEYQSLAKIMENSSENIKAIETDTAKINRLKSAIIQSMQKKY